MNLFPSVILATAVIAAMMTLRIIVARAVSRARGQAGSACDSSACFGGCATPESTPAAKDAADRPTTTRGIRDAT